MSKRENFWNRKTFLDKTNQKQTITNYLNLKPSQINHLFGEQKFSTTAKKIAGCFGVPRPGQSPWLEELMNGLLIH